METKWKIGQKVLVEVEVAEIHIDAGSTKYILKGTDQKDGFKIIADESEIHSLDQLSVTDFADKCKECGKMLSLRRNDIYAGLSRSENHST